MRQLGGWTGNCCVSAPEPSLACYRCNCRVAPTVSVDVASGSSSTNSRLGIDRGDAARGRGE
jgi:hypothetical protein